MHKRGSHFLDETIMEPEDLMQQCTEDRTLLHFTTPFETFGLLETFN